MRAVLIILGIAIVALALSILTQESKDLSPAPQEDLAREVERQQQEAWKKADAEQRAKARQASREFKPPMEGARKVTMTIAGKGRIVIEVYPKAAPRTVAQFVRLANEKFYDNLKFHRVEKGFVVQAGDPDTLSTSSQELAGMGQQQMRALGIGAGGSGTNIPFETNKLAHIRGTVAMALSSPRSDTGDSQFFINLSDNVGLNEDYCVFGKVVEGMEIVDRIAIGDVIESMRAD